MPSGAKKRKASKKKMDNNYATHTTVAVNNQSMNGDDEIKQLSEEGERIERIESVRSNVSEKNSEKEVVLDGGNDKISSSEKDESSDSSSSEGSSGSSSDSDDESRVIENLEDSVKEIDYKPSVKETVDFTSSEQASVNVSEGILQTDLNHDGGNVEIENSNGKILAVDSENDVHDTSFADESHVIEKVETSSPLKSNKETDYVPHEFKDSVKETDEIVDSDKTVLDYAIESDDSSSDDEKVVDSNKPVQNENGETDTVLENLGTSIEPDIDVHEKEVVETAPVNAVAEVDEIAPHVEPTRSEEFNNLVEETMSVLASINVPTLNKTVNLNGSNSVESVSNETVEKSLSTDDIAESQTDEMKDTVAVTITENGSDNHEAPESQPLLNSARRTVQTTSWKSCCGIFDLFNGGNRY
jgi:hypothetical protein